MASRIWFTCCTLPAPARGRKVVDSGVGHARVPPGVSAFGRIRGPNQGFPKAGAGLMCLRTRSAVRNEGAHYMFSSTTPARVQNRTHTTVGHFLRVGVLLSLLGGLLAVLPVAASSAATPVPAVSSDVDPSNGFPLWYQDSTGP